MLYHKRRYEFSIGHDHTRNRLTLEKWLDAKNDTNAQLLINRFDANRAGYVVLSFISGFCGAWIIGTLVFGRGNIVPFIATGAVTLVAGVIVKEAADDNGEAIANTYNLKLGMTQVMPGSNNYTPTLGLQYNLYR